MSRYVNSVQQILDGNGDPIVGAKKVFYTVGTTNLKTIYSDADFGTPRTNPVTADSAGRFPEIFLDGLYDEVQQDATGTVDTDDGATIWTRDDIGSISTGQFALWLNDTTYSIPEIVLGSNDEYYRSLIDANQGNDPTTSAVQWEQLRLGRVWNTNVTYAIGDSAYGSDGHLYIARVSQSGNDPISDTTNWEGRLTDAGIGIQRIVLDTVQASTSGSTVTFTSIPSWVKKITVMYSGVSANGTAQVDLLLGDSGGLETSNYDILTIVINTGTQRAVGSTSGFRVLMDTEAAGFYTGVSTLTLIDAATFHWVLTSNIRNSNTNEMHICTGFKTLSDTLTQLQLITTDTYDAGSVNILYEG